MDQYLCPYPSDNQIDQKTHLSRILDTVLLLFIFTGAFGLDRFVRSGYYGIVVAVTSGRRAQEAHGHLQNGDGICCTEPGDAIQYVTKLPSPNKTNGARAETPPRPTTP
uniref:Uncharacterized protein n=1 Tax=Glossina palpalis gambiensis TaxID=67801 RepID=A0A1B0BLN3_9MUSC